MSHAPGGVELRPLCSESRRDVEALTLDESQVGFVPSVKSSLELASQYTDAHPMAVVDSTQRVVGFAMYGKEVATGHWKIFRLLIGHMHQNQGYGRAATKELIRLLREKHGARTVLIAYQKENRVARNLYRAFGFCEYDLEGDKVLARLDLTTSS